jgi:hypothetical protein
MFVSLSYPLLADWCFLIAMFIFCVIALAYKCLWACLKVDGVVHLGKQGRILFFLLGGGLNQYRAFSLFTLWEHQQNTCTRPSVKQQQKQDHLNLLFVTMLIYLDQEKGSRVSTR